LPTIKVKKSHIEKLLTKKLEFEELDFLLFNFKGEIENVMNDEIEIELSTDRLDLLCASGLARAFRSFLNLRKQPLIIKEDKDFKIFNDYTSIRDVRPYIASYIVRNVKLDTDAVMDIIAFQEKLHEVASRERKRFAVGLHDVSKIRSHELIYAGLPPDQISFVPLGNERNMGAKEILKETQQGKEYGKLLAGKDRYPLFYSKNNEILSMPPIINSELTKLTDSTTTILIDVTGDSFETVKAIAQMLAVNIAEYGGEISSIPILCKENEGLHTQSLTEFSYKSEFNEFRLDPSEVESVLGLKISPENLTTLLEKCDFKTLLRDHELIVQVPRYRLDVLHKVDIIEDIAIMYGYHKIEPEYPRHYTRGKLHPLTLILRASRNSLSSLGFVEVNNFMLASEREIEDFTFGFEPIRINNPKPEELNVLRTSIISKLLSFLSKNKNKPKPIKIFETGGVCYSIKNVYKQSFNVAALICDNIATLADIKSYLNQFALDLGLNIEFRERKMDCIIPKRGGKVFIGDSEIGVIGEIKPEILLKRNIEYPVAFFELRLFDSDLTKLTF
jgi:phenylalanyl-tRNA synthetase beta chain